MDTQWHSFHHPIKDIPLPTRFTYPFHYTPHPLCILAAREVQEYLEKQEEWQEELRKGKMFGVLLVRNASGEVGYLAAFSGILAGRNNHPFFVPPIYDLLSPDGFFQQEEREISAINRRIEEISQDSRYRQCQEDLQKAANTFSAEQQKAKEHYREEKARRAILRQTCTDADRLAEMTKESQFQKAELKRMERAAKEKLEQLRRPVTEFENAITTLKQERKQRSAALQRLLFSRFEVLNALGAKKNLCDIFAQSVQKTPPAGAGECAAPKLLQYAYLHGWKPLAMAEFWWGESPKEEIRRHGHYYPSCKGKCAPILAHMLQGLDVDPNPLANDAAGDADLDIIYEDPYLWIVNKPAGMQTVPGKEAVESVYSKLKARQGEGEGVFMVHRLDMATSGLLVVAKDKETHLRIQRQFLSRTVEKRYIALVEKTPARMQGTISLPLAPDFLDRPRQKADPAGGKQAITRYKVLHTSEKEGYCRIAFYPLTGRTHQLRVHAAHPEGLDSPIVGDALYGQAGERLCLHAESLTFIHPATGKRLTFTSDAPF